MGRCCVELKFPSPVTMGRGEGGGGGVGTSFRRNDFRNRLAGQASLMIGFVNGCLENHLPSKTNVCPPKRSHFHCTQSLYLFSIQFLMWGIRDRVGTPLLLLLAITQLGRKLDQNSSPKTVPGCKRKQNRPSLKRKFKMAN